MKRQNTISILCILFLGSFYSYCMKETTSTDDEERLKLLDHDSCLDFKDPLSLEKIWLVGFKCTERVPPIEDSILDSCFLQPVYQPSSYELLFVRGKRITTRLRKAPQTEHIMIGVLDLATKKIIKDGLYKGLSLDGKEMKKGLDSELIVKYEKHLKTYYPARKLIGIMAEESEDLTVGEWKLTGVSQDVISPDGRYRACVLAKSYYPFPARSRPFCRIFKKKFDGSFEPHMCINTEDGCYEAAFDHTSQFIAQREERGIITVWHLPTRSSVGSVDAVNCEGLMWDISQHVLRAGHYTLRDTIPAQWSVFLFECNYTEVISTYLKKLKGL